MPISVSNPIERISQDDFMAIDHEVMRHAFAIHNRYGAFCDENIYRDELACRCENAGLDSVRETQITVTYESFRKPYYIDLLVEGSAVYELKADKYLTDEHCQQLLNYLLLTNLSHGKLIAFGDKSVRYQFVSTKLDNEKRRNFNMNIEAWTPWCDKGKALPELISSLLNDWGGFLSVNLYREALSTILSDNSSLVSEMTLLDNSRMIGSQKLMLLSPDVILFVTGYSQGTDSVRNHLKRLLDCSKAKAIQWVNFNHHDVIIETIK